MAAWLGTADHHLPTQFSEQGPTGRVTKSTNGNYTVQLDGTPGRFGAPDGRLKKVDASDVAEERRKKKRR